jgi:hypothetical protein
MICGEMSLLSVCCLQKSPSITVTVTVTVTVYYKYKR